MGEDFLIVDEKSLRDKIYTIRGVKVMLDFDLAKIYGYKTGKLNEQVKNNADRFIGEQFMFQLNKFEFANLRSKNRISSWGGRRSLPYAFTEQGIYMLMTVLKGELAVEQSRKLVVLFKKLKNYYIANRVITDNERIAELESRLSENSLMIDKLEAQKVSKTDLSVFMRLFDSGIRDDEVLIFDGEPFKADLAYQKIYSKAKKSVIVVDDYIGVKTLRHFVHAPSNVAFIVVSDNKGSSPLRLSELNDFKAEYPGRSVTFLKSMGKVHDRYIILDDGRTMKVYHCGASSKDAGKKITTIMRIKDVGEYKALVKLLSCNPVLGLK